MLDLASRLLTLANLLVALTACSESYDLQGPAPKKGQTVRVITTLDLTGAAFHAQEGDRIVSGTADMTNATDETWEHLEVSGGRPVRSLQRFARDHTTLRFHVRGETLEEPIIGPLSACAVLHERNDKGGWSRRLMTPSGDAPLSGTAEQRAAVKHLGPPPTAEEVYPQQNVRPGHTWMIEGRALRRYMGEGFECLSGSATLVFEKVIESQGRRCAQIKVVMQARAGLTSDEGQPVEVEVSGTGTEIRDLERGLSQSFTMSGQATYMLNSAGESGNVTIRLAGPATLGSREEIPAEPIAAAPPTKGDYRGWGRFRGVGEAGDWISPGSGKTLIAIVVACLALNGLMKAVRSARSKSDSKGS